MIYVPQFREFSKRSFESTERARLIIVFSCVKLERQTRTEINTTRWSEKPSILVKKSQTLREKLSHAIRFVTSRLTVLLVQQDLELIVNLALEALLDPGDRFLVRQLPVHESAAA